MQIIYKNQKLKKICTNAHEAERKHGLHMAKIISMRIDQISAADTVEELVQYRIGRCHLLTGDRKDQYAMDLIQPFRLVFLKIEEKVQIAKILEIVDYH